MTIEEVLDFVHTTLTFDCAISNRLRPNAIRMHIERIALPMFYRKYDDATQRMYYFVRKEAFNTEEFTKFKYLTLPCEIQAVTWVYPVKPSRLWNLGTPAAPSALLSTGSLINTQLTPYITTIGDIGVYKSILESFADMMNTFSRFTVKRSFNPLNHRLHVLTDLCHDLVLECEVGLLPEDLYEDPYFLRYIVGWAKQQLGNLLGRMDVTLQGNVKYNYADLVAQGTEEMAKVWEEINAMSKVSWFYMVNR